MIFGAIPQPDLAYVPCRDCAGKGALLCFVGGVPNRSSGRLWPTSGLLRTLHAVEGKLSPVHAAAPILQVTLFVDYAGATFDVVCPKDRRSAYAQLFVATLACVELHLPGTRRAGRRSLPD